MDYLLDHSREKVSFILGKSKSHGFEILSLMGCVIARGNVFHQSCRNRNGMKVLFGLPQATRPFGHLVKLGSPVRLQVLFNIHDQWPISSKSSGALKIAHVFYAFLYECPRFQLNESFI